MSTATMTSKGQITVPKDVRDALKLEPGSKVMFVEVAPGHFRIIARTGKISDLAGMLHRPGQRTMSLEEMDAGIAEAAAESGRAGLPGH
jgi:AbrB family looped-hinge helix DNA binding protein